MTRAEFAALPAKDRYERGDRVLTWDRVSRPVLPGVVAFEYIDSIDGLRVCVERDYGHPEAALPRWRVRLAPEQGDEAGAAVGAEAAQRELPA